MEEENIAFRLKFLIQKLGINSTEFADTCGISRATLSQLLTGRNKKISDKILGQIHQAYPNVSIMWLLFNEGKMLMGGPEDDLCADSLTNNPYPSDDRDASTIHDISNINKDNFENETAKNPSENSINATGCNDYPIGFKENGLKSRDFHNQNTMYNPVNPLLNTIDINNKIENSGIKQRNVVQITIYYDDNTFECFYPGKSDK